MSKLPAIVLAHGLIHPSLSFGDQEYFGKIAGYLLDLGYRVLCPRVPNMGHIDDRAKRLRSQILDWPQRKPGERVVLISHSMGGLDARWLVSPGSSLNGDLLTKTLVTIGTPHQGSCTADIARHGLSAIKQFWSGIDQVEKDGIECLTTNFIRQDFNPKCPDSKRVHYFSVGGDKGPDSEDYNSILKPSFILLSQFEGPNDGAVSVKSARWGTYIGTFPLDHIEQVRNFKRSKPMYDTILRRVSQCEEIV